MKVAFVKSMIIGCLALSVNVLPSFSQDEVSRIAWDKDGTFSGLVSIKIPPYFRPLQAAGVSVGDFTVRVYWEIKKGRSMVMMDNTLVSYDGEEYEAVSSNGNTSKRYEAGEVVRIALTPGTYRISVAPESGRGVRIGVKSYDVEVRPGLTTLKPAALE